MIKNLIVLVSILTILSCKKSETSSGINSLGYQNEEEIDTIEYDYHTWIGQRKWVDSAFCAYLKYRNECSNVEPRWAKEFAKRLAK